MTLVRFATLLALETKVRASVSAREPAAVVAAVTVTLPVAPAARFAGLVTVRAVVVAAAVTSRLSW